MKLRHIISLLIATIGAVNPEGVTANDNSRYDAVVAEILSNNPTLSARKASLGAEKFDAKAESNLSDPEVEFEHQWGHGGVGNKWSISVSQSFDWPGVYRSRSKAADAKVRALSLLYDTEVTDMRLKARTTLNDYVAACEQLRLRKEISSNLSTINEAITRAFDLGEATILDRRKIEFERLEAEEQTKSAQLLVDQLRQELIALNGGKYIDLSEISTFPSATLASEDYYLDKYESEHPAIAAQQYLTESARQNLAAVSRSLFPGFSLGYIHNVELGDHFNGLRVGMSLPLFSVRHRRAAAAEQLASQLAENDRIMLEIHLNIVSDYARAHKLKSSLNDYDKLFPNQNDDYLHLLRRAFDGGQMTLIIYLYELNYYSETRSRYIDLQSQFVNTMASLNRFD